MTGRTLTGWRHAADKMNASEGAGASLLKRIAAASRSQKFVSKLRDPVGTNKCISFFPRCKVQSTLLLDPALDLLKASAFQK